MKARVLREGVRKPLGRITEAMATRPIFEQEMCKGLDRFDMSVIRKGASITAKNQYLIH